MVSQRFALTAIGLVVLAASSPTAAPDFSDWFAPENLGPIVNSSSNEGGPALSKNGRSLYFQSNRPGGLGQGDLYVSQRNTVEEPWGPPIHLDWISSSGDDAAPNLSRDGHWLFFASNRLGSQGFDIWVSYRGHIHDDLAWQPPVNVVSRPGPEFDTSFFENDEVGVPQLFISRLFGIFVSDLRPDGTFGAPTPVTELNTGTAIDRGISVRFDGLEAFFHSSRPGGHGSTDIWTATRETVLDPWSEPTNLGPLVNSAAADQAPDIASDRETLHFTSDRPGGYGGLDLYVATRTRHE